MTVVQSQQLAAALGGPILLSKGPQDVITDGQLLLKVSAAGSPRRCGGQGDVLTGAGALLGIIGSELQSIWVLSSDFASRCFCMGKLFSLEDGLSTRLQHPCCQP
jgi:NAD(P)H-hydrate repair Nnr-like enzyme with NAD(P)H-hydrate dehydratase domain